VGRRFGGLKNSKVVVIGGQTVADEEEEVTVKL